MKSHTQALLLSSAGWLTTSSFLLVRAEDTNSTTADVYEGCDLDTYYADLLSLGTPDSWTMEQIREHLTNTHRNILPSFPTTEVPDDIVAALIDLWPASAYGTGSDDEIHLIYSDQAIASRPALGLENWRPEQYWPMTRGALGTSATFTDVHQNAPADYSVLDDKEALNRNFVVFYGECGTVKDADLCVSPANVEAAEDTAQDGKIYTPEAEIRGDIARGLFYDEARYVYLTLTDCPPFAEGEYGYRSALLEWHTQDPPDEVEQARNDRACRRWQGNRNIFIDYPDIVPRLFGEPDFIVENQQTYNECIDATEAPTATPNECSAIGAGDISVFGFNSVDPDQILFYPVANIPAGVGSLFVTTHAWDGETLLPTGKTIEYVIPENGIDAGVVFAYNAIILNYTTNEPRDEFVWNELDDSFNVDNLGDHFHLYCMNADSEPHFIFSLGFNSVESWKKDALPPADYGKSSALPRRLNNTGSVLLPGFANWFYNGTQNASASVLIPAFSDADNWISSDNRFEIDSGAFTFMSTLVSFGCVFVSVLFVWM